MTVAQVYQFPARFDDQGRRYEPWLSEKRIALHFDVDGRTVRRWREAGMPSQLVGGSRRYQVGPCEDWHRERAS